MLARAARWVFLTLVYGVAAVVLTSPLIAQRTIEDIGFADRLGSLPVQVSVVENGYSVVDTGALGSIFLDRTGIGGLGISVRVTGPPDAGGTLSSYVDPGFVQANTAVLTDLDRTGEAYSERLRSDFLTGFALRAVLVALIVGWLLAQRLHPALLRRQGRRRALLLTTTALALALGSGGFAAWQHAQWTGTDEPARLFALDDPAWVRFDSPQAREVAMQVGPFIDKNLTRLRRSADEYVRRAEVALRTAVSASGNTLKPREGEQVILAEADPQGSQVGTRVRRTLYAELAQALGEDAIAARTISGDITSNGTVAEKQFVEDEVDASPDVPVLAVKGDHDSRETLDQIGATRAASLDGELVDEAGYWFSGAADPEFKSLFGGSIRNPSGVTPLERGEQLRAEVDDSLRAGQAVHVLTHQNDMAEGYLGLDDISGVRALTGPQDDYTEPVDDGVPDLPPGSITYGHWHESDGPWVVWNTDTDETTWTLVDQVGTSGGVEEEPTFNRFSTPYSPPLKPIELRLHYLDTETGLVTGFVSVTVSVDAAASISPRRDVGIPLSR